MASARAMRIMQTGKKKRLPKSLEAAGPGVKPVPVWLLAGSVCYCAAEGASSKRSGCV
jgi:hypothetical protein